MSGRSTLRLGPGGKDLVVLGAREELAVPSRVELPPPTPQPTLLLPDGSINWGCPCLGGMATGPCATQFRDAFSCFHYSEAEPKGSDCYEKFSEMQSCMSQYPELYGKDEDDELAAAVDAAAVAAVDSGAAGAVGDTADADASQSHSGGANVAKETLRSMT